MSGIVIPCVAVNIERVIPGSALNLIVETTNYDKELIARRNLKEEAETELKHS